MLKNEKYVGEVMLQKTYVDNLFEGKQMTSNGALDKVLIQNHHQRIIDRELFVLVNDKSEWSGGYESDMLHENTALGNWIYLGSEST